MKIEYFKERLIAYLIDYFMIFFIMTLGLIPAMLLTVDMSMEMRQVVQQLYIFVSIIVISIGYFSIYEWRKSSTLGKLICKIGIQVDSEEVQMITFTQSLTRNFLKIMPELIVLDFILGFFIKPSKVQRAGEVWSKTTVIEISDPMRLKTKQARKVRDRFKIVLTIGGALLLLLFLLRDVLMVLDFMSSQF